MKYKYIGTEEQLKERKFETYQIFGYSPYALRKDDINYYTIHINLNKNSKWFNHITFNYNSNTDDITPYIQDLIDANLVEVIEEWLK